MDVPGEGPPRRKTNSKIEEKSLKRREKRTREGYINNVQDTLRCFYTNVDSLPNKFDEFETIIKENLPLVCGVTEIKPKNNRYSLNVNEFNLDGYNVHSCNVDNDVGRGVILYTHKSLNVVPFEPKVRFQESVWVKIKIIMKN